MTETHETPKTPGTEPVLLRETLGPVRRLTLNRPHVLNALSGELVASLSEALAEAAGDPAVRVIVLRGAGRAFCAGYDLKEEAEHQREQGPLDVAGWQRALAYDVERMLEVFDHPKPVIAEVHGYCLAGGCDLMMMCDLAVAAEDAVFGEPEIRFGAGVVTMVMPWLIGARKAKELLLTGEDRVDAAEALRIGLVNRVVPREGLEAATLALANGIAILDPVAISMTKRAINRSWEAAGFRQALAGNVDIDAVIEAAAVPERKEFNRIREEQGLKAAIAWRDARFRSGGE
ncbi:MAG TPA: enoyl-CoA hydratase-related protein [Candidatus Dormibacteraeota bacterium]|nr:enoyl-CoA hydratase-related protein [Candidatus Dormibacteraeota bacterium]